MTLAAPTTSHIRGPRRPGNHAGTVKTFGLCKGSVGLTKDSHEIFARNLRFWLAARSRKPADLARHLEKSKGTVSHWFHLETAPDLRTAGRIADWLEIPLEELYREDPTTRPKFVDAAASGPEARRLKLLHDLADELGFRIRVEPKKA
jgi:transcriptional regulator with XRE-family HTH domain